MSEAKTPELNAPRLGAALAFAVTQHGEQVRKGTRIPYISHPLAVASLVLEHGGDEDEVIAALLHDVAEDCGGQKVLDEIREQFGEKVAAIVAGCTDTLESPKPAWRSRKEAYIAHLDQADRSVLLVAAADKLHNARSILNDYRDVGGRVWERFTGGKEGALWYYRAVASALARRGSSSHNEELQRTVGEMFALAGVSDE